MPTYLDRIGAKPHNPEPLRETRDVAELTPQLLTEAGLDDQLPGEVLHQLALEQKGFTG